MVKKVKLDPVRQTDSVSTTSIRFRTHPLLRGVPRHFVSDQKNKWDPHSLNIEIRSVRTVEKHYQILVDGERAPVVLCHKKTLATQFKIDQRYPESI